MSADLVLTNAHIVLSDDVIHGSVSVVDGRIASIDDILVASGVDLEGDYLIPGLVELHTDHLEGHYAPRPGVRWNPVAAVMAHDAQITASGMTTVFDAVRIGTANDDADVNESDFLDLANAINDSMERGRLRADHRIHVRCEVSAADCLPAFERFRRHHRLSLASLMDHAPGQRQFAKIESYAAYYQGKLKMSDEAFAAFCEERLQASATYSAPNRAAISDACRANGIVLASHDDATLEHVAESVEQGARVAEFPTTTEAAMAAHNAGLSVLMGAPNLVRGGSHSGNVSADELLHGGHLDILSSDYVPFSLLQAAFLAGTRPGGIALPQAIALVSANPASSVGLVDRGAIEVGLRGDLVRVRFDHEVPIVRSVWRQGERVG